MRNSKRRATVLATGLMMAVLGSTAALAQKPPTDPKGEPMRGTWGFSAWGTTVPAEGTPATPVAVVGLMTFDPLTRDCLIEDRLNAGGTFVPRTSDTCTYSLLTDGRGSVVALFPGDPEHTFYQFVLVKRGREMQLIRADSIVMEGVAQRQ